MNNLVKYKLLALCMLWCPVIMAQSLFTLNETIQTPQTQSFIRYGNNPVDLYTGSAGVSIPVYTYKDNDFEIPISLEYASNGLVANQQTGILGLGWYLNAGGVISRTVVGIPDELLSTFDCPYHGYYHYHKKVSVNENNPDLFARGKKLYSPYGGIDVPFVYLAHPEADVSEKYETTPDIFNFNFMGYQGSFQFDVNGKISVYNTNNSKCNFKIKALKFDNRLISSFEITTNDGYKYIFGGDKSLYYDRECLIASNGLDRTVISWQMTEVIAPNGRKISLVYRSKDVASRSVVKNIMPSSDYTIISTAENGYVSAYEFKEVSLFPTYLEKIVVDDVCSIQLDYTSKEPEKFGTTGTRDPFNFPALFKLSSVTVNSLSPVTEQILHCDLRYRYSGSDNKVLFLNEVDFGGGKIYKMKYMGLDQGSRFPLSNTCAVDHWGYYNGNSLININDFIPSVTTDKNDKEIITNKVREANAIYSQLGMLKQISYPTGGYTTYEYEGNSYSRRSMDQYIIRAIPEDKVAGGVRVKAIADYTEEGECNRREFTYKNLDGSSSGILLKMPRYRLNYTLLVGNLHYYISRGNAQDMSTYSLEGSHIEYARVEEKKSDGSIIEYKYTNSLDPFFGDVVQTADYDLVFKFNEKITSDNAAMVRFIRSRLRSNAHKRGLLSSLYTTINGDTVYSEKYSYTNSGGKWHPILHYTECTLKNIRIAGDIFYIDVVDAVDKAQIGSKTITEYSNGKAFTTQKEYTYQSSNGRLDCISTTYSGGDIMKERIEYLEDMSAPSAIEKTMVDSFLTSVPARRVVTSKKQSERMETVIRGEYNKFKKYGKLIKLEEVRKTAFDQPDFWAGFNLEYVDSDFHNDTYDAWGNLTKQTAKDGSVTSYVWGYKNRYPVAIQKDGLTTRYEFKPMVGITSVTDARGIKTYYEYDKEGRLQCIKDNDGNVVSRYDYHYGSQINN